MPHNVKRFGFTLLMVMGPHRHSSVRRASFHIIFDGHTSLCDDGAAVVNTLVYS